MLLLSEFDSPQDTTPAKKEIIASAVVCDNVGVVVAC